MSFLFNFGEPDLQATKRAPAAELENDTETRKEYEKQVSEHPATEIQQICEKQLHSKLKPKTYEFGQHLLTVVDTSHLENLIMKDEEFQAILKSSHILLAAHGHSDLVTGSYEGGLKIWECAIDLTEFIYSGLKDLKLNMEGKHVLELGCGAGLPGIMSAKIGATAVHFQDYNEEVLKLVTGANVKFSLENQIGSSNGCRFFSGDWCSFQDLALGEHLIYDVILTAETIYNVDNYEKLHSLFDAVLADDGFILLAAKSYYFGVGGSIAGFQEFLNSKKKFSFEIVFTTSKGVPRSIMILKRTND